MFTTRHHATNLLTIFEQSPLRSYALESHFFSNLKFHAAAPSSYKNQFVFPIIVIRLNSVPGVV